MKENHRSNGTTAEVTKVDNRGGMSMDTCWVHKGVGVVVVVVVVIHSKSTSVLSYLEYKY